MSSNKPLYKAAEKFANKNTGTYNREFRRKLKMAFVAGYLTCKHEKPQQKGGGDE